SGQNSWGGADSSTTPSSTGLSTSQTSSTGAKSEVKNYDWLNRRLSEQRSPHIRSRLEDTTGTGVRRELYSSPSATYMQRREALKRATEIDPFADSDQSEGLDQYGDLDQLDPLEEGLDTESHLGLRSTLFPERKPSESKIKTNVGVPVDLEGKPRVIAPAPAKRTGYKDPALAAKMRGEAILISHPEENESQTLTATEPRSAELGREPAGGEMEEGGPTGERFRPMTPAEEQALVEQEALAAQEEAAEEEEMALPLLPSQRTVSTPGEEQEEEINQRVVRPLVPTPNPSQYDLETQRMWSEVPVRQPRNSQFGTAVDRSMVPFERSRVRYPGVYSGYEYPIVGGNNSPGNTGVGDYQYRGPRLYSIGQNEYDSDTDYQSLPYYRR
ncbi:MAG: hypothetical protein KC940_08530, partial [Candidatus Omnitrophica bacterium]|nr:hypothetical protein [Candidatus Omnitrophota bacterium]